MSIVLLLFMLTRTLHVGAGAAAVTTFIITNTHTCALACALACGPVDLVMQLHLSITPDAFNPPQKHTLHNIHQLANSTIILLSILTAAGFSLSLTMPPRKENKTASTGTLLNDMAHDVSSSTF